MTRVTVYELNEMKQQLESMLSTANEIIDELEDAKEIHVTNSSAIELLKAKADKETENISMNTEVAEDAALEIKAFQKEATGILARLKRFDERLSNARDDLTEKKFEYEDLHKRVEDLLPGATSAGLASAFKERKESFKAPAKKWEIVFGVALIGLFL